MIKYCLDCWNKNQQSLREQLEKDASLNSCEYEYLVKLVTRYILGKEWDAENITVVDNGDYQGTLLFLIPRDTYQPSGDRRKFCVNDKKGQYEKQRLSQEWK